jgi:thioesterase domain-containing protein
MNIQWYCFMTKVAPVEYAVTNLRLPREDLKKLKHKALEQDKSVNALVRELIRRNIDAVDIPRATTTRTTSSVWNLPKRARATGKRHLAERVDKILYGT